MFSSVLSAFIRFRLESTIRRISSTSLPRLSFKVLLPNNVLLVKQESRISPFPVDEIITPTTCPFPETRYFPGSAEFNSHSFLLARPIVMRFKQRPLSKINLDRAVRLVSSSGRRLRIESRTSGGNP
jgi:hypothetical protein